MITRVDCHQGIPRCCDCRAYINPFVTFFDYGHKWSCNICGKDNDVPEWYYAPLDASGKPVNVNEKPELVMGSVEAVVEGSMFNMNERNVGGEKIMDK